MIYKEINFYDFSDEFDRMNRSNHFSYNAKKLLYDYLDDLDSWELDIIELCCEFTEYDWKDLAVKYDIDTREDLIEYLQDCTLVLYDNETIIIQDF